MSPAAERRAGTSRAGSSHASVHAELEPLPGAGRLEPDPEALAAILAALRQLISATDPHGNAKEPLHWRFSTRDWAGAPVLTRRRPRRGGTHRTQGR